MFIEIFENYSKIKQLNKKADDAYNDTSLSTPERMKKADKYLYQIKDIQRELLKDILDKNFKSWKYDGKTNQLAKIIVKGKKNGDRTDKKFIVQEQGISDSKGNTIVIRFEPEEVQALAGVNYYTLEGH